MGTSKIISRVEFGSGEKSQWYTWKSKASGLLFDIWFFRTTEKMLLLLTRLHISDHSRVVKWAGEKVSPAGGPTGVAHSSRMAGVNPEASPALCCIPHLPDMDTSHHAKVTNSSRLQSFLLFFRWLCTRLGQFRNKDSKAKNWLHEFLRVQNP